MKNKVLIVFLLSGWSLSLYAQTTLDDCIRYAWEHNLEFENAQLDVKKARTDYAAAVGKFIPNLSLQAKAGRNIGRSVDSDMKGFTFDPYNQGMIGIDVTYPLFEGFARINRLHFTRLIQKEKQWDCLAKQNDLAYQVTEAYYKAVLNEKLLQLAKEQLQLGEHYLKKTEAFLELGLQSASDLGEMKARHQGDIFRCSTYEKNKKLSLLYLKELIGMKEAEELPVLSTDEDSALTLPVISADELYVQSLHTLPDYKRMDIRERAARKDLSVAFGQLSPTIYAYFSWRTDFYNSLFSVHQLRNNWNKQVGLGISFPIFSGLDRYASIKKKKFNLQYVRNSIEKEKLHLRTEAEQIALSIQAGWEEHRQTTLQVEAEAQVLKETERKWEEGVVSIFQLLEARNRLLSAKAEQVRVRLQYELASRLAGYYQTGSFLNSRQSPLTTK